MNLTILKYALSYCSHVTHSHIHTLDSHSAANTGTVFPFHTTCLVVDLSVYNHDISGTEQCVVSTTTKAHMYYQPH